MDLKIKAIEQEIENAKKEVTKYGERVLGMIEFGMEEPAHKYEYVKRVNRLSVLQEVHKFLIGDESYKL